MILQTNPTRRLWGRITEGDFESRNPWCPSKGGSLGHWPTAFFWNAFLWYWKLLSKITHSDFESTVFPPAEAPRVATRTSSQLECMPAWGHLGSQNRKQGRCIIMFFHFVWDPCLFSLRLRSMECLVISWRRLLEFLNFLVFKWVIGRIPSFLPEIPF